MHEIILPSSDENQSLRAELPELPGWAADGPMRQEARANDEAAIGEWIETAREMGRDEARFARVRAGRFTGRIRERRCVRAALGPSQCPGGDSPVTINRERKTFGNAG